MAFNEFLVLPSQIVLGASEIELDILRRSKPVYEPMLFLGGSLLLLGIAGNGAITLIDLTCNEKPEVSQFRYGLKQVRNITIGD